MIRQDRRTSSISRRLWRRLSRKGFVANLPSALVAFLNSVIEIEKMKLLNFFKKRREFTF